MSQTFLVCYTPSEDVGDCFSELIEGIPINEYLTKFANYVVDNYIED
jgi:hypothetical protein